MCSRLSNCEAIMLASLAVEWGGAVGGRGQLGRGVPKISVLKEVVQKRNKKTRGTGGGVVMVPMKFQTRAEYRESPDELL